LAVEVLAPFVDALVGVIAWVGELFLHLFASCIRSLRYAFSPEYRKAVNVRLEHRGSFYRLAYASWGLVAVVISFVAVAALIYWIAKPSPTPAEACSKLEWRQLSDCARAVREALPK
jgi:hypothetical protein